MKEWKLSLELDLRRLQKVQTGDDEKARGIFPEQRGGKREREGDTGQGLSSPVCPLASKIWTGGPTPEMEDWAAYLGDPRSAQGKCLGMV